MTRLDPSMEFLLCWAGSSLFILSLVSGKQIHYLLPAVPAVSLILTRLMTAIPGAIPKRDLTIIVAGTIVLALVPLVVNRLTSPPPAMIQNQIDDWYAVPLMACGLMLIPFSFKRIESTVFAVGTASILFVMVVIVSARTTMWKSFDLRPLAQTAASHNDVAWYGEYDGQLNYLGGIQYVHETDDVEELAHWLSEHPDGIVVEELSAPNVDAMATDDLPSVLDSPPFPTATVCRRSL